MKAAGWNHLGTWFVRLPDPQRGRAAGRVRAGTGGEAAFRRAQSSPEDRASLVPPLFRIRTRVGDLGSFRNTKFSKQNFPQIRARFRDRIE